MEEALWMERETSLSSETLKCNHHVIILTASGTVVRHDLVNAADGLANMSVMSWWKLNVLVTELMYDFYSCDGCILHHKNRERKRERLISMDQGGRWLK